MYLSMRAVMLAAACALSSVGCAHAKYGASFRHQQGAAIAPPGVAGGTTNTVRISDISGPLSRAGVYGLAVLTAAGAYRETSRTTSSYRQGDYIVTETTSSGYIDQGTAAAAGELAAAAVGDEPVGLQASLDIASRSLGGDTSGWMYQLGYKGEPFLCGPRLMCRFYGGFGIGRYTFHDRMRTDGSGAVAEARYSYIGVPLRLDLVPSRFLTVFVQADLNIATVANAMFDELGSPSPWHAGVEVKVGWVFGRVQQSWGRATWDSRSTTLEVGLGF